MCVDHDGQIRMDCSSPYAMTGLIGLKNQYRVAFGNDPDSDRHGIVTPSAGLMNPNHFLAVAVQYLFSHRPEWPAAAGIGKTVVSSAILDRVAAALNRKLFEVPVGFKWFVGGLLNSITRVRRRGERRAELPPPQWVRLVHGQGRHHRRPACGGNHDRHRQGSRATLPRHRIAIRPVVVHPCGSTGDPGPKGGAEKTIAGSSDR